MFGERAVGWFGMVQRAGIVHALYIGEHSDAMAPVAFKGSVPNV